VNTDDLCFWMNHYHPWLCVLIAALAIPAFPVFICSIFIYDCEPSKTRQEHLLRLLIRMTAGSLSLFIMVMDLIDTMYTWTPGY